MKKLVKSVAVVLTAIFALTLFNIGGQNSVPFTVDVVSAATEETATPTPATDTKPDTTTGAKTDAVSSASVVNNAIAFQKSIGAKGKWIVAITKDMSVYSPITLEGTFSNGKKDAAGNDAVQRKIALYKQNAQREVTKRFTLRAPKLTIKSPNASIEHGTFVGDLYVSVPYFKLIDAKVRGNIYFTSKGAETTFTMDSKSAVTGKKELQLAVDAVSAASLVDNDKALSDAMSIYGKWIICTTKDVVTDKELVLDGNFKNGKKNKDGSDAIQRKIGLYTQDDKKNVTARFTLTAPKLTINSPNARIQSGIFKGNVYVNVPNFQLVDAKVDGNVYFTTRGAQTTFTMDAKSTVTGKQELKLPLDAISSASIVENAASFEQSIGIDGKWIVCTTKDLVSQNPLVLEGKFYNGKKDAAGIDQIQRKIGLYTQDDKKNVTARFSLTAPKLTILSPNARIQGGTFRGDLYVNVPYFQIVDAKVVGNIYFTTVGAQTTFKMDAKSSIIGNQELKLPMDAISSASIVDNGAAFEKSVGIDGKWIICTTKDIETTKPLVLEGDFLNGKKDASGVALYQRKIAPYTQDAKRAVTARFTITAPKLTILSKNASYQHGTFKGDIYVAVPNFQLVDTKVDGNVYFTTQEAMDTFVMDAQSAITGVKQLKK